MAYDTYTVESEWVLEIEQLGTKDIAKSVGI